jgi:sirohydrochlorin cobaltochelatase
MMRDATQELIHWLEQGGRQVGQVLISRTDGGWELRHVSDVGRTDLAEYERAADARGLANVDDAGVYRPLKTAPNLRRGWRLVVGSANELRKALDALYPAMLGVWLAHAAGEVVPVPLRETLGRQTGMYRVTQKLTDGQAQEAIARTCHDGACLKTILWTVDAGQRVTSLPAEKFRPAQGDAMPLLCQEACNILVSVARKVVKGEAE